MTWLRRLLVLALLVLALPLLGTGPAPAVTDRWASWSPITGSANAYVTRMQQRAPGFPAAAVASDSRSNVQLPAGTSTFLGASTPPGAKFGSSAGSPYVVLRPKADTPTGGSTTTYSFDHPTPDTGWAFVLGDIDSDQVRVRATDVDGAAVPAAEIDSWFDGTFNYAGGLDQPTWSAVTSTLTGNPAASDTDGASGWFEPDVRLTSLTFVFTRRAGFPVYQTWFVSRARPIGGLVDDVSATGTCPVEDSLLTLVSPYGEELATTHPSPTGEYGFGEFATQGGYVVRVSAPASCAVVGPAEATVSNRGNDGDAASRATFELRRIIPQPISGTVRDVDGNPVAGATVTLDRPGAGGTVVVTTGPDGTYLVDDNPVAAGYTLTLTVPDGYAAGPGGTTRTGIDVAATPITGQDFVVRELPTVSGQVTGGGSGLGGVQVVLTPSGGGAPVTTVTDGDGSYAFSGVPAGPYDISIAAPDGYAGTTTRSTTVAATDVDDQDFALTRPGAVAGQVTNDGAPVEGVTLTVDGPGAPQTVTTDADGAFFVDGLVPGSYDVTVEPPAGLATSGPATVTVTITATGEIRGGLDFVLTTAAPSPTASPSESPTSSTSPAPVDPQSDAPTPSTAPGSGDLPDTGGPPLLLGLVGMCALVGGAALVGTWAIRRPRRRH